MRPREKPHSGCRSATPARSPPPARSRPGVTRPPAAPGRAAPGEHRVAGDTRPHRPHTRRPSCGIVTGMTEDVAISVAGLRKTYDGKAAVDGVDLTIRTGECFALLGPNGAGKTTTVEILEGFRKRDAGQVSVLGVDPAVTNARRGTTGDGT